jgi:hypothetical protein
MMLGGFSRQHLLAEARRHLPSTRSAVKVRCFLG